MVVLVPGSASAQKLGQSGHINRPHDSQPGHELQGRVVRACNPTRGLTGDRPGARKPESGGVEQTGREDVGLFQSCRLVARSIGEDTQREIRL